MSLAVLIPYRPDTAHRERIYQTTAKFWSRLDIEVVYCDDGLTGPFSYAAGANRARAKTSADYLLTYSVDALPMSDDALARLEATLLLHPWAAVFGGQRRFTAHQTRQFFHGQEPYMVGPPEGEHAWGREAVLGVRADVWDEVRGYDERFVGWGPEDLAFHAVLKTLFPKGRDEPTEGLFHTLWHPPTSRETWPANDALWHSYRPHIDSPSMRDFYASRP